MRKLYGPTPAATFGPRALKVVRQAMVDAGWTRRYINRQVGCLRHVFKWGVENELVRPAVHQGLTAVAGLKRGKGGAREAEPVTPVPDEHVYAIEPHTSRQVWAMVELQLVTGMRSGEVTAMRPVD